MPLSVVILSAVTTTSSTDVEDLRTKDSLDVSPTTKLVVIWSDNKPAAVTLTV